MPRNSRRDFPGLFHHIMSQGINKEYIFDNDKLKKMYIDLIKEKSEKNNVKIMAYCIMDNHVHMLINVDKIEEMCKFMQQINTAYAKFYNKEFDRVGYVFRNRYLSKAILDEGQLKRCIVYIHKNPVEAKIVEHERDYIFSSFNEYIKDDNKSKIICPDVEKILFGDIPKETENLIKIVEIRNKARKLGITRILATDRLIKFEPMNLKITLTNDFNNDILIRVMLEINKIENTIV